MTKGSPIPSTFLVAATTALAWLDARRWRILAFTLPLVLLLQIACIAWLFSQGSYLETQN